MRAQLDYPQREFAPDLEYPSHLPLGEYAVNLGLALRGLPLVERPEGEDGAAPLLIDLAPPRKSLWRLAGWAGVVLAILAVGLALNLSLLQRWTEATLLTDDARAELTAVEGRVGELRADQGKVTGMEKAISEFRTLLAPQGDLTDIIAEMLALDVPGVQLTSVAAEPSKLSLSGSAAGPSEALAFVNVLRETGKVGEVSYKRVQTGPQNISISTPRVKQASK